MPRWLTARLLAWGTLSGLVRWWCEEHPDKPPGHDGCEGAAGYPTVFWIEIK